MTRIRSVFNLLKRVGFALLLLGKLGGTAQADTTWVSGQVGGVWGMEGSPYVIVDSSWVNPQLGLSLTPGTEVVLSEPSSRLVLAGRCELIGSSADSISVRLLHFSSLLKTLPTNTGRIDFEYVRFLGTGYHNLSADTINVRHCTYEIGEDLPFPRINRGLVTIENSVWKNYDFQFVTLSIRRSFISQSVIGWFVNRFTADSVYQSPEASDAVISINTFGNGTVSVSNSELSSLSIDLGETDFAPLTIRNVTCGSVGISFAQNMTIAESRIVDLWLDGSAGIVRNNILNTLRLHQIDGQLTIRNNTVSFLSPCEPVFDKWMVQLHGECTFSLYNNIFYSNQSDAYIVWRWEGDETEVSIHDNITFGMSDPWRAISIGARNSNQNPLFDPNSHEHALRYDSPCINQGDPAQNDPDGSRSDIGSYWWDHRQNHPPIITTPDTIQVQWGDRLSLELGAIDEGPVQIIPNIAHAGWLFFPSHLDDGAGLVINKIVPYGAESFSIGLLARDEQGLTDHAEVHVLVLPRSELMDTLSGTLPLEYSPYHLSCTVSINTLDTLRLEPGVEVLVDSVDCMSSIHVEGVLIAQGTPADSVSFAPAEGEMWSGINLEDSLSSLYFDYVSMKGAIEAISADTARRVQLRHSFFGETDPITVTGWRQIWSWAATDSVIVQSCDFDTNFKVVISWGCFQVDNSTFTSDSNSFEFCLSVGGTGTVTNCTFNGESQSALIASPFYEDGIKVANSHFDWSNQHGWCINLPGGLAGAPVRLYNLTMNFDSGAGIGVYSTTPRNIEVKNCILSSHGGTLFNVLYDTVGITIENNCWYGFGTIEDTILGEQLWHSLGILTGVNVNGDSVDVFGNLSTDPMFSNELLELNPNSPCIDAGQDVGLPFSGVAPDIGYWEYEEGFPPTANEVGIVEYSTLAFPNPFNPTTTLSFLLPQTFYTKLTVFDVLGRAVMARELGMLNAGVHEIVVDGKEWSSGIYFASVVAGEWRSVVKMALLR